MLAGSPQNDLGLLTGGAPENVCGVLEGPETCLKRPGKPLKNSGRVKQPRRMVLGAFMLTSPCLHQLVCLQIQEDSMKELSQVRVEIEEMDERIADAKKDMYDFRRDIIDEGQDPRTGKTIAEKMVKYLEDRVRNKDTMIEKLRLKNASLKVRPQLLFTPCA